MKISKQERRNQILALKIKQQEKGTIVKSYDGKYFSTEHLDFFKAWLKEVPQDGKQRLLKAGTGAGKTYTTVTELAKLDVPTIFCVPNIATAIELSNSEDYDAVACFGDYNLIKSCRNQDLQKGRIIFMTYKQLNNLIRENVHKTYKDFYLIIDEAHCLVTNNEINRESISALIKMEAEGGYFRNILFITATPKPLELAFGMSAVQTLEFRRKKNELRYTINNMVIDSDDTLIEATNYVLSNIKGKALILSPTDKMLNKVLGEEYDATVISADNKSSSEVFQSIVKNKIIPHDAPRFTIMTDLLSAGLNLMNEDIENVVIAGTYDQTLLRQFPARLRNAKHVNVYVVNKFDTMLEYEFSRQEIIEEVEKSVLRLNTLHGTDEKFNKKLEMEEHVISYVEKSLDEDFTIFEVNEYSIGAVLWKQFSILHIEDTAMFYPEGEARVRTFNLGKLDSSKQLAEEMKNRKEAKKLKAEIEVEEVYDIVEGCTEWLCEDDAIEEIKDTHTQLSENQIQILEDVIRKIKIYPELPEIEIAKMVIDSDYESCIRYAIYSKNLEKAPTKVNQVLQKVKKIQLAEDVDYEHSCFEGIKDSDTKKKILTSIWNTQKMSERPAVYRILGEKATLEERGFSVDEILKLEQMYVKKVKTSRR